MPKLMDFLSPQKRLIEQQQAINELTKEVAQLRGHASMYHLRLPG
jgi:uncharacterized protein YhaN